MAQPANTKQHPKAKAPGNCATGSLNQKKVVNAVKISVRAFPTTFATVASRWRMESRNIPEPTVLMIHGIIKSTFARTLID